MWRSSTLLLLGTLCSLNSLFAQEIKQDVCDCPGLWKMGKGTIYFAWGYNRDWFSKSDIHFKNKGSWDTNKGEYQSYDFTIYDAKAHDRSQLKYIFKTDLTIPQYNYRLGYYFNNKKDLGIEINFDHVKYIMTDYQTLHVKGWVNGTYIDQDTLIDPDNFVHFEHSDGANFLFLNFIKRQRLLVSHNKKHWLSAIGKIGAGVVIPRTDVELWGERINNCFHVAGYGFGLDGGLRYDFFRRFFLEYTLKVSYTNFVNAIAIGNGRANHYFYTGENILTLGVQFPAKGFKRVKHN
jgi:hypothetical protein